MRQEEKSAPENFSDALPYHYAEVAYLLLHECEDEFTHFRQVRSVLEDITEARREKLARTLRAIDA